ncbi:MAG: SMC-Scp complex subunit ScpB [Clostridia bacterium]|nr:SMC-Scp complex subunit ScpB [Clostridia bacterium]
MNMNELQNALEAVLFAVGEPIEIERLSQALEVDELLLGQVLENLRAAYDERNGGLCILKLDNKYQICSRKQYADQIRKVLEIKRNAPLSQAAFEVLAIIAYNQPVTKAFVEQIRGVDCSGVISTLCQRSLIEEKGRLDLPGRPLIYGTTSNFLRCFCLSSLDDLPAVPENNAQNGSAEEKKEEKFQTEPIDFVETVDEN